MDDLISRQAAIKLLEEWADGYSYLEVPVSSIAHKLNELPTAEKKGSWVCEIRHYKDTAGEFDYQYIYCSECGEQRRIGWRDANYCPNCGARMENAAGVPDSSIESC